VKSTLENLLFLLIPMTAGLMLLALPAVRLLYERGQFDANSTVVTASALIYLCIGVVGYGVQNVLIRLFYAHKDGKMPLISGLFAIATNALLCYLLVDAMGVSGLALASGISLTVSAIVLVPSAHKRLGGKLVTGKMLLSLGKMAVAAMFMAGAVYLLNTVLVARLTDSLLGQAFALIIPAVTGVLVYFTIAALLRVDACKTVLSAMKKRLKRG